MVFADGCPCQQDLCERLLPKVQKAYSGQEEQDDGDGADDDDGSGGG